MKTPGEKLTAAEKNAVLKQLEKAQRFIEDAFDQAVRDKFDNGLPALADAERAIDIVSQILDWADMRDDV